MIYNQKKEFWDYDISPEDNLSELYDEDALNNQIRVYLMTSKGERLFNLSHGSPFLLAIFSNITDGEVESKLEILFDDLESLFPVTVDRENTTYDYNEYEHSISFNIKYKINGDIYSVERSISETLIF